MSPRRLVLTVLLVSATLSVADILLALRGEWKAREAHRRMVSSSEPARDRRYMLELGLAGQASQEAHDRFRFKLFWDGLLILGCGAATALVLDGQATAARRAAAVGTTLKFQFDNLEPIGVTMGPGWQQVQQPPLLFTLGGFGTDLVGNTPVGGRESIRKGTVYLMFGGIPVVALKSYLYRHLGEQTYQFIAEGPPE